MDATVAIANPRLANDPSSVRSATIFFSRLFSSSRAFSRRISSGSSPAYFFFQLK